MYWAQIPLQNKRTDVCEPTWMPYLLPHEVLHDVFTNDEFACGIDEGLVDLKRVRADKCAELGWDPRTTIPLGFFGDGVPHQKRKPIECLSWNLPGHPSLKRILCGIVDKSFTCKCGCARLHSLDPMMGICDWSVR